MEYSFSIEDALGAKSSKVKHAFKRTLFFFRLYHLNFYANSKKWLTNMTFLQKLKWGGSKMLSSWFSGYYSTNNQIFLNDRFQIMFSHYWLLGTSGPTTMSVLFLGKGCFTCFDSGWTLSLARVIFHLIVRWLFPH